MSGPSDNPDIADLTGPDLLADTVFDMQPPAVGLREVSGTLAVPLAPGWYAVVFGSGAFAAPPSTGVLFNTNVAVPSVQQTFIINQNTSAVSQQSGKARIFVEAVPN